MEEDTYVLHDTSPAVNYKKMMEDFAMRHYLSKPDLAMSMAEPLIGTVYPNSSLKCNL